MKPIRHLISDARRHRGLALIIVLSMLALATIVILAFLSVAETEHKATVMYSSSQTSRRFADTAVNMVIAQIRSGSAREVPGTPVIHATQPGAVRKYAASGNFMAGYKLFSDQNMIYRASGGAVNQAESEFVRNSEPPADWNFGPNKARYVDLNEPVIKGVNGLENAQTYFPIIDPRAGQDGDAMAQGQELPIEGFSYETKTALKGNDLSNLGEDDRTPPILKPSGATQGPNINSLRLAMPVQWLYILKDGAVGYLNDAGGRLVYRVLDQSQSGLGDGPSVTQNSVYGVPSETNPIVGRVAFWTDDETSKININTASEPTFAGQPIYYHERDRRWANYPPARYEYQRFPGHPATVALSSVLYPNPLQNENRSLDTYGPSGSPSTSRIQDVLDAKEVLYGLVPRVYVGGSRSGTRTFEQDKFNDLIGENKNAEAVKIHEALGERLYASVDELLFDQGANGKFRKLNQPESKGIVFFNKTTLERSSAFLTAHSRGSEINLFGLPRIAMWPLPASAGGAKRRTGYDNMIEFCARLGPNQGPEKSNLYIFQRQHAQTSATSNGATFDIKISRNVELLNMLDKIMEQPFPTANHEAGGNARSFRQKLGQDNARQVLVSMFDYIRTTNLYDSFLIEKDPTKWLTLNTGDWPAMYKKRDEIRADTRTYTPVAVHHNAAGAATNPFLDRFLPGHGQVTPSVHPQWKVTVGGQTSSIRGFGRFLTVSEIGMQFICTADGQPDMYSWRNLVKDGPNGGETASHYKIPELTPEEFDAAAANPPISVSGGRTALMVDPEANEVFKIVHEAYADPSIKITNAKSQHWADSNSPEGVIKARFYSNYPPDPSPLRYGVVSQPGSLGDAQYAFNVAYHPGHQKNNWNYTLPADQPLKINEKMIQAVVNLELFCPSVGYTEYFPDYTIVVEGMGTIEVNGVSVFKSEPVAIRSRSPLYDESGNPEVGGFASFRNISVDRRAAGQGQMPSDVGYGDSATADPHENLMNLDLVSKFFKMNHGETLKFRSSPITLKIYDRHVLATTKEDPVQTIQFRLQDGKAPSPDLVVTGSHMIKYTKSSGAEYHVPSMQAPRWWVFNRDGALNRTAVVADSALEYGKRGRLFRAPSSNGSRAFNDKPGIQYPQSLPGAHALIYTKDPGNFLEVEMQPRAILDANRLARIGYGPEFIRYGVTKLQSPNAPWVAEFNKPWHFGTDTVRTLQPASGDPRLIASKVFVSANEWTPHRWWDDENEYVAHNFSSYGAGEAGFDRGSSNLDPMPDNTKRGLPPSVNLANKSNGTSVSEAAGRSPDAPHGRSPYSKSPLAAHEYIQRYYDFDDTDPGGRIGPYINKPDEGNFAVGDIKFSESLTIKYRATYFKTEVPNEGSKFANAKGTYFTPNRMVPSPVIMGSLPSRMWDANSNGAWTNLLFRPYVALPSGITGSTAKTSVTHPGEASPPDHYLLDLFWMPVVEPYAISESLSSAGKINLNYQMLPFTHIRRATAIHAAMKSEIMAAMPNKEYGESKVSASPWGNNASSPPNYQDEANYKRFWHRTIAVDRFQPENKLWWEVNLNERVQGTLRQFEERFNFGQGVTGALPDGYRGGLFRTTSQLCEVHLIPNPTPQGRNVSASSVASSSGRKDAMAEFWGHHASTGDNTKERPYANLYAKFTTRSNTFRVHVRSQSIQKATRSVAADEFDPDKDLVGGEFRGSFLLERYIDQADLGSTQVNYAAASNPFQLKPLENYYRFRVIESKRFAP